MKAGTTANQYFEGIGRRKEATARVRIYKTGKGTTVNGREHTSYFKLPGMQDTMLSPLGKLKLSEKIGISVKVQGGGLHAQSEAIRLGLSRALIEYNAEFRKKLARIGYLRRDAREKERKKYGLKKARRAPQWAKR